jgi:hypothetical protein
MKKKILFLIALLIPFIVNAKEELTYGWDYLNETGTMFLTEKDNEYLIGELDSEAQDTMISYFTPAGKKLRSKSISKMTDAEREELSEISKQVQPQPRVFYESNGKYIGINPMGNRVIVCPNKEAYSDYENECEEKYYDDLTEEEITNYVGDYKVMFDIAERYPNGPILFKRKGNLFIVSRLINPTSGYIEVYNLDGKRLLSKQVDSTYSLYSVDVNLNGIYLISQEIDYDEKTTTYELSKYDLQGKKEYSTDLKELIEDNSDYDEEFLYNVNVFNISTVNGGLVINLGPNQKVRDINLCVLDVLGENVEPGNDNVRGAIDPDSAYEYCKEKVLGDSHYYYEKSGNDKQLKFSTGPSISSSIPTTVIKLNLEYEVATKVEGKGNVKVINRSGAGEGVTFVVEPAKGYVLGVVKVTDALGNVIEFHDYTFTMPSSDVLIEVEFVKENPNTADIAIVTIIGLAIIFGIVLLNVNKKYKWLK